MGTSRSLPLVLPRRTIRRDCFDSADLAAIDWIDKSSSGAKCTRRAGPSINVTARAGSFGRVRSPGHAPRSTARRLRAAPSSGVSVKARNVPVRGLNTSATICSVDRTFTAGPNPASRPTNPFCGLATADIRTRWRITDALHRAVFVFYPARVKDDRLESIEHVSDRRTRKKERSCGNFCSARPKFSATNF